MSLKFWIGGVDFTEYVAQESIKMDLEREGRKNRVSFHIQIKNYSPLLVLGADIYVVLDGVRIFGGFLRQVRRCYESDDLVDYDLVCVSWSKLLEKRVVVGIFDNMMVKDIVNALMVEYASDFNFSGGSLTKVVSKVRFNYVKLTDCLDQLANLVAYSWEVDEFKSMNFFDKKSIVAPFAVVEGSEVVRGSLFVNEDEDLMRNQVFVRGGEYHADFVTEQLTAGANQSVFAFVNRYFAPTVRLNGAFLSVGVEGVDVSGFQSYYNERSGHLRLETTPNLGQVVAINGQQILPLLTKVLDRGSFDGLGERSMVVNDRTIKSKSESIGRGLAEIRAYAGSLVEGGFRTVRAGLRVGQQIHLTSVMLGIDEDFVVATLSIRASRGDGLMYEVQLVTLRTITLLDYLLSSLSAQVKVLEINPQQVLSWVEGEDERVNVMEGVVVNGQLKELEVAQIVESVVVSLAADIKYHYGSYGNGTAFDIEGVFDLGIYYGG